MKVSVLALNPGDEIATGGPLSMRGTVATVVDLNNGWAKVTFDGGVSYQPRASAFVEKF